MSLDTPQGTLHQLACNLFRGNMGSVRQRLAKPFGKPGFVSLGAFEKVQRSISFAPDSLLAGQFAGRSIDHQDSNSIPLPILASADLRADDLLEAVLEGFLLNSPPFVGRLMRLRNVLVMPLGLRRSALGCPVSSLLDPSPKLLFRDRYPVLDQRITDTDAQIVLGADDTHLIFRTNVRVTIAAPERAIVTLEDAVHCRNRFGRFYMAMIGTVHRRLIAPAMLRNAVAWAARDLA